MKVQEGIDQAEEAVDPELRRAPSTFPPTVARSSSMTRHEFDAKVHTQVSHLNAYCKFNSMDTYSRSSCTGLYPLR